MNGRKKRVIAVAAGAGLLIGLLAVVAIPHTQATLSPQVPGGNGPVAPTPRPHQVEVPHPVTTSSSPPGNNSSTPPCGDDSEESHAGCSDADSDGGHGEGHDHGEHDHDLGRHGSNENDRGHGDRR